MSENNGPDVARGHASAAYEAIASFNRATMGQAAAWPSEISDQIAYLAALAAALPQAFAQLSSILESAATGQVLRTDSMVEERDPKMAIDLARLALYDAQDLAVELYKLLDAAHNATAHISTAPPEERTLHEW